LGPLCLASVVVTLDQSVEFDSTPVRVLTCHVRSNTEKYLRDMNSPKGSIEASA
jgi:hypothetical protein